MKKDTNINKSDSVEKEAIIKAFADLINKEITGRHEVTCLLRSIQNCLNHLPDFRVKYDDSLPFDIRKMRDIIRKSGDRMYADCELFDQITDDIQGIIMLTGANAEGIDMVSCDLYDGIEDILNS